MKKKKKLISILLTVSMMLTLLPFAAFAEEPAVFQTGGQSYNSLQEAANNVEDGGTITVLNNVTINEQVTFDKNVVLDLNGKILKNTYSYSKDSGKSNQSLLFNKNATIQNGQYVLTGTGATRGIKLTGHENVFKDVTFNFSGINVSISAENAKLTAINTNISGSYPLASFANNISVNLDTCTINGTECGIYHNGSAYGYHLIANNVNVSVNNDMVTGILISGSEKTTKNNDGKNQQAELNNCTVSAGTAIEVKYTDLTLTDCEASTINSDVPVYKDNANGGTTIGGAVILSDNTTSPNSPAPSGKVIIKGDKGKYKGAIGLSNVIDTNKYPNFKEGIYEITGGTFTNKDGAKLDVSEYLAGNVIQNADGTVVPLDAANAVAQVGTSYYKTLASAVDAAQNGETVTLLKDIALDANLNIKQSITLNCGNATVETNGHKFLVENGADVILTAANGGIKNTAAATSKEDLKSMLCVSEGGTLTIQDGNYSTKAAQLILSNGKVIIENGKFICDAEDIANNAAINEKVAFNISGEKASLIFKNGSLQADVGTEQHYMLYGIYAQGGASLVLGNEDGTGPTVKSIEPPIGLNNTTSAPAVDITVNGGTYQSRVDAPQDYEQFNGVFYLSGACNVVINNGNFVAAHPSNTYNHIISIPYKNVAANVTIKNGSFSSSSSIVFEGTKVASVETGAPSVNISGGTYSSDVTKYCEEGLMAQLQGNKYVIVEVPIIDVEVEQKNIVSEPEVSIDAAIPQDKKDDAQKVAESVAPAKSDSIAPQLSENTQKAEISNAVSKLEANGLIKIDEQGNITAPTGGDITVTVVREAYFDVRAVALENDTFTLDITPKYNLLATTDENLNDGLDESKTVTIAQGKASKVSGDVKISVQLPENFANNGDTIFVQHKGYEYKATVSEKNGELIATFTNPHGFSEFTFSKTSQAVATIGNQSYTSLQAAVDAVKDGETIALIAENKENVTVGREVSFTLDTTNGAFNGKMEAGNGFNLTQNGNTYTVTKVSTGGGIVVKRYDVTLADTDNGSITATHKRASKNSTVTITATPAEGYVVDAVTVTEKDGDKVEVTKKDDNKYTFKMPASDVTVKVTFKVAPTEPEQPSGLPFTDVAKDAWYFPAVEYVFNNGLMNGTTATTFAPNVELNRAMMAAVLYNMEGGPACDKSGLFSDVADGKWYTDAVNWAASNNIVSGMPDGTYAPDQALTREQMASVLYRYAEYKGIDVSARADLSTFTDGTTVSPWAQDVVQWAVAEKLMSGNGNELQPKGTASRAQVATVLMNYSENVAK